MPDTSIDRFSGTEVRPVVDIVRVPKLGYAVVMRCTQDSSVAIGGGVTIEDAKRRAVLFAERLGNAVWALKDTGG
jgi:hypothetical protein